MQTVWYRSRPIRTLCAVRLGTRQRVLALASVQLGDAVFDAVATDWIRDDLERLRVPYELRRVFPIVKTASAAGLLAGLRWPRLGRLTTNLLVLYFLLALGAHARAKDKAVRYAPAAAMLGWSVRARHLFETSESSGGTVRGAAGRSGGAGRSRAA